MILADDEPVITKGIKKLVDWKGLGIEIMGEYEDGKSALDGIIREQPDLALLDIHMPKKSGIDILKELKQLGINTRIILISGFQDFQYAKDALTFGAVDYLLKPIIKDELVSTVQKCLASIKQNIQLPEQEEKKEMQTEFSSASYKKLLEVEDCSYLPVVAEVIYEKIISAQEQKLIRFSVISFLEDFLEDKNQGIVFVKNQSIVIVIKNPDHCNTGDLLWEIMEEAKRVMTCRLAFIEGEPVDSMGKIPEAYERSLLMEGYFYFANQFQIPVFRLGTAVFKKKVSLDEIREGREQLLDTMVAQEEKGFLKACENLKRLVSIAADGRKEDACFHYASTIRILDERFETLGIKEPGLEFKEILARSRETGSYEELAEQFFFYFCQYKDRIRDAVAKGDKKDIIHAREYIEKHYMENLTLEVMAGETHMNPYYFSSFFKKNSGENFKDYLNKVRLKHGISLLVSTDKKTADIAQEVGFRDHRSFAELFHRFYGETPSTYRKRVREKRMLP
jgi:two-component system response regulator YesN